MRAGRSLAPASWPGGARVAVALSFDADHETIWLRDGQTAPGRLSQGEYGARAAVPRILRLLDRRGIPASFYVPAVCAMLRPAEVLGYVQAGHEVALHGWIHERNADLPALSGSDSAKHERLSVVSEARAFRRCGWGPLGPHLHSTSR